MRCYPENEKEMKEALEKLGAKEWQLECLKKNSEYVFWGNHEEHMRNKDSEWCSPIEIDGVENLWKLDDYNELVNFYFMITRRNMECKDCGGSGLNPETKKLSDAWYSFDDVEWIDLENKRYNNKAWQYHLTEVEIKALVKAGRLHEVIKRNCYFVEKTGKWFERVKGEELEIEEPEYPTPEEVNDWAKTDFMGHDSSNQWIALKTRAEHLGVFGYCKHCSGSGRIYTENDTHLALQMWFLHPRKGAARGVLLKDIKEEEVPKVIEYLKQARDRNAEKFSKL